MKLIRTDRGFQFFPDDCTPPSEAAGYVTVSPGLPTGSIASYPPEKGRDPFYKRYITICKDMIPILTLLASVVSWMVVKYVTSDRMQQQQMDDHVQLGVIKDALGQVGRDQATMSGQIKILLEMNMKDRSHDQPH